MDLGDYYPCLTVADLEKSVDFYTKLGFDMVEDHRDHTWCVMRHRSMVLCLFQGHIDVNLINFRGGDIEEIVREGKERGLSFYKETHVEKDGSAAAEIHDPDGNCIYFNTYPEERERYVKHGRLID